jgi:inhibitor of KinA
MQLEFKPLGDAAVRAGLAVDAPVAAAPDAVPEDLAMHRLVQGFCGRLEKLAIGGVIEWVGAYDSVTVFYRPTEIGYRELCDRLLAAAAGADDPAGAPSRLVTLPVCYGGDFGPDIAHVAEHAGLSAQGVIDLHSGTTYLVRMMGFAPGFAYLSGLPGQLATPRLATPRPKVPAGSVGIGGSQTGVYPIQTPGGWHIIGHTPMKLYDPAAASPFLLSPGDSVRFVPVGRAEHDRMSSNDQIPMTEQTTKK